MTAQVVFNDGSGPALVVAGSFQKAGGVPANNIAKWNGTSWSALGAGITINNGGQRVRSLAVFDDGTGPALYAGGDFSVSSGSPADGILKWDGQNWIGLPSSSGGGSHTLEVLSLAVFDDGGGEDLYVAGRFLGAGATQHGVVQWDGIAWSGLGNGLDNAAFSLAVWDDGGGEALYAGGNFRQSGQVIVRRIAKWDGIGWSKLQAGMTFPVYCLAIHDDGSGSALYAGGKFTHAGGVPAAKIARWDGLSWSSLGSGLISDVNAMQSFDDGSGAKLYVSNALGFTNTSEYPYLVRWDGVNWMDHGDGTINTHITWLGVFDDGTGAALYSNGPGGIVEWSCEDTGSGSAACFGDGTGTSCPCGSTGSAGSGCGNSIWHHGARLVAVGSSSLSDDGFSMHILNVPKFTSGLILRGSNLLNAGNGLPAGAGLLCVSGQVARSHVQSSGGGFTRSFFDWHGVPLSSSSLGTGIQTNYQFWYRDINNPCLGEKFNFSNAWTVTYVP